MARLVSTGSVVVVLLAAAAVFSGFSPHHAPVPHRDSGVFLYVAQQIVGGRAPYVDVWDHKPPGVYFLNALGLSIGAGSLWGVWAIELVSGLVFALVLLQVLKRSFGNLAAASGVILACLFIGVTLRHRGNFTEEYVLPLQAIAMFLLQHRRSPKRLFGAGICGGLAFLFKPNAVGVWVALCVFLCAKPRRALVMLSGCALPVAVAVVALTVSGDISEAWDQVVTYNRAYSSAATAGDRLRAVLYLFDLLNAAGALLPTGVGVGAAAWLWSTTRASQPFLFAFVALPIELAFSVLSGRVYEHYVLVLVWLVAFFVAAGVKTGYMLAMRQRRVIRALSVLFLVVVPWKAATYVVSTLRAPSIAQKELVAANRWVSANVAEKETLLVWGAETTVNFMTARRSPTKWCYAYPLITAGYASAEMTATFVGLLRQQPPAAIIDTSSTNELIPPLDARIRSAWQPEFPYDGGELQSLYDLVEDRYLRRLELEGGWVIYTLKH